MSERLTKRINDVVVFKGEKYDDTTPAEMTINDIRKLLQRLADFEDSAKQTKGDRIRAMTDDELAEFIANDCLTITDEICGDCSQEDNSHCGECDCIKHILEYLKKEV